MFSKVALRSGKIQITLQWTGITVKENVLNDPLHPFRVKNTRYPYKSNLKLETWNLKGPNIKNFVV